MQNNITVTEGHKSHILTFLSRMEFTKLLLLTAVKTERNKLEIFVRKKKTFSSRNLTLSFRFGELIENEVMIR